MATLQVHLDISDIVLSAARGMLTMSERARFLEILSLVLTSDDPTLCRFDSGNSMIDLSIGIVSHDERIASTRHIILA